MADEIRDAGRYAWREYDDPEVESELTLHKPDKEDIFDFVDTVQAEVDTAKSLAGAGTKGYLTEAAMTGDLTPDEGTIAKVSGGGTFVKVGPTGTGNWTAFVDPIDAKVETVEAAVTDAETAQTDAETAQTAAEAAAAAAQAALAGVVIDPDGHLVRQQIADATFRNVADQRARSMYFLDGAYGDDAYSGGSSLRGKATVAGLLPKTQIVNANVVKADGFTAVYKVTLDKGAERPRGMEWAVFLHTGGIAFHFSKVESIAECDQPDPSYYDPTPGARVSDVYFSVAGGANPITNGLTYYAQMTAPNDGSVAARAGSVFKAGQSFDPPSGFQQLIGVGRGDLPVFDCTKVLEEADFQASTHDDAGGVVYETVAPIVAESLVRYLNDPAHSVLMTDTDGLQYPMEIVTSVAFCAAKRGTVYFGTPGDVDTDARGLMTGAVLYIHPRWGKDPTDQSDGTAYAYSYTARAFTLTGQNGATDRTDTHQGQIIEGVVCIAGADGQGPIENEDSVYRRISSEWSGKHGLTIEGGRVEDCVIWGIRGGANGGDIPMQGYATNVAGLDFEYSRLLIISPDHHRISGTGLYCHGNVGAAPAVRHNIDGFVSYNGWGIVTNSQESYINDALFLSGPIERTATSLAALTTSAASDAPADREVASVTAFDSGNAGQWVWRADLATPAYEKLSTSSGRIQANIPTAGELGKKTIIRRALSNTVNGSQLLIPSAGGVADLTSLVDARDCFFSQRDGYTGTAIEHFLDVTVRVLNNIILLNDNGLSYAFNTSQQFRAGSEFKYNIIVDFRTNTGGGVPVAAINPDGGGWDYNVYCIVNGNLPLIYVDGVGKSISNDANFATYKAAVAAEGIDVNSVALYGDDWQDLFVGDPREGDLRLRSDCTIEFTDGSLINTAGVQTYMDWNKRAVLTGQPAYLPIPPKTQADSRAYARNPAGWNWRTGAMDDWALTV